MKIKTMNLLSIAVGLVGVYFIYDFGKKQGWFEKKKKSPPPTKEEDKKSPTPTKVEEKKKDAIFDNFLIAKGSKGNDVKLLQQALGGKQKLPNSYKKGFADGIFGQETENVLKSQTGKIVVNSMSEIDKIASKNGLVKSMTTFGYEYIPKSQQNILAKGNVGLPPFSLIK
jgi:peptidoglycan hydrolase-like protein with peptidoglycan-binding domain